MDEIKSIAREQGITEGTEKGIAAGRKLGFDAGFEDGRTEGLAKVQAETQEALDGLKADLIEMVYLLNASAREWFLTTEEKLTNYVTTIAQTVLASELELNQQAILQIVRDAIESTGVRGKVKLRINPLDKSSLEAHRDWLRATLPEIEGIELVDDPSVRSGCVIDTHAGVFDASTEGKLLALGGKLKETETKAPQLEIENSVEATVPTTVEDAA